MKAVLASPHFCSAVRVQPQPDNPDSVYPIDEYALAFAPQLFSLEQHAG